jgi:hypothetical protein
MDVEMGFSLGAVAENGDDWAVHYDAVLIGRC